MNLTMLEKAVLVASHSFWNYGDESEKEDNAVCFNVKDLSVKTGISIASLKGVVGSLFKKGLFCEMSCGEAFQNVEIGITDAGIDAVLELKGM